MRVDMLRVLMFFVLLLAVSACSDSSEDDALKQKLQEVKQKVDYKPEDGQNLLPTNPEVIRFQNEVSKTPFREPVTLEPGAQHLHASPLQAYPISVLELIGTITEGEVTYAYITTPDKRIHRADYGDQLGDKGGHIVRILPGKVEVELKGKLNGKQSVARIVILELKEEP